MFPGAKVIVNKVFEKCLDERVNVRKSALQVISSIFKFSSKWMTSEALAVRKIFSLEVKLIFKKNFNSHNSMQLNNKNKNGEIMKDKKSNF